jgi:hypothetical protein
LTVYYGMTKIDPAKKPVRAKPGPKPKPESAKVVKKTVSLRPQTYQLLLDAGEGVLSQGIEAIVAKVRKK